MPPAKVVIVGGGISGLSAAYYLSRAGIACTLIEKEARLGGVIRTDHIDGCVLERGPDSFLSVKTSALELIRELGLADQVIGSNDHLRRTFVLRHGRLVPLPDGLMMVVPTKLMPTAVSPLLGIGTKMRMAVEYFRRPSATPPVDRSVAEFLRDHYGQETVDYLGEPLLAGVYGGDPGALSVNSVLPRFVELERKYGSLTRGVLASRRAAADAGGGPLFQTLKGGLSTLVDAMRAAMGDRVTVLRAEAEAVEQSPGGWRVRAGGEWMEGEQIVIAARAWQSADLLRDVDPTLAGLLGEVPYSSSMTLSLGYRRADIKHPLNGFGFLVPARERRFLLACTWVGIKFPNRVPENMSVLRCFMTGEALENSDEQVVRLAREDLKRIMGMDAEPAFVNIARWPRAMAQYTVGHENRLRRMREQIATLPGLHFAGNAWSGIGIPDCIRTGREAAEAVRARAAVTAG